MGQKVTESRIKGQSLLMGLLPFRGFVGVSLLKLDYCPRPAGHLADFDSRRPPGSGSSLGKGER